MLAFAVEAALLPVGVSGLLPALQSARGRLREGLHAGGRGASPGRASHRLRGALMLAQVALSLMLLVAPACWRTVSSRCFTSSVAIDRTTSSPVDVFVWGHYETGARRAEFVRQAADRIGALPGVRSAGVSSSLPLGADSSGGCACSRRRCRRAGRRQGDRGAGGRRDGRVLETLRIPLRRAGSSRRRMRARVPVAVISESMAHRLFPGMDALGRRLVVTFAGPPEIREVVSVVGDVRHEGLDRDPRPPCTCRMHSRRPVR